MFAKTDNPYRFRYLITGIKGDGIKEVYLPPVPAESEILFKKANKFVKPQPSEQLKEWMEELVYERNRKRQGGDYVHQDWIHPHQEEINAWEDQEWERSLNGIWFWNKGVATYMTGRHYKYLTAWDPGFEVEYRETDKETFYWIQFWEDDNRSFGGLLNTLRREGKSSKIGFWIMDRTSTNENHLAGMQGEDNTKIKDFYEKHVMEPFYRMPYYYQPIYDTTTLQKKGIVFNEPPRRHQRRTASKRHVLRSRMDYRTSEENKYDQAKLHSFAHEEMGKTMSANVHKRWGFIKPCLMQGKFIVGKHFGGTTVEYMDTASKGGKAYQKLCMESDYNIRTANDETVSGLYAALMPADCAVEGFFDEFGHPDRQAAMKWILAGRDAIKNNPADYASLVRKYPTNWREVFYVSAEDCEFNIKILQDRKSDLMMDPVPIRRFILEWENKQRFSKVVMVDHPHGWFKTAKIFTGDEAKWYNNVARRMEKRINPRTGVQELMQVYSPLNDDKLAIGVDPIDHGVVIEDSALGEDGFVSRRKSRPVLIVKRKYDSSIDGPLTQELLIERAESKYPYKTGIDISMMDNRPEDPNIFFERALMVAWLLGCSMSVESQKPGLINWCRDAGCEDFVQMKYVSDPNHVKRSDMVHGTSASQMMIQEYTGLLATDVQYFGHTYPFLEIVDDLLAFKPRDTQQYDYAVAKGWLEIGVRARPRNMNVKQATDITKWFRAFDANGRVIKM